MLTTQASVMESLVSGMEEAKGMGSGILENGGNFEKSSTNFYKRDQASNNLDLNDIEDNDAVEVGGKKKKRKRNKKKKQGKAETEESQLSNAD